MGGNGEPTAGGSALWKIHLQACRHFEHGNCEITEPDTASRSFSNIPLIPQLRSSTCNAEGLCTTDPAELGFCFWLKCILVFEVKENCQELFQRLNPCIFSQIYLVPPWAISRKETQTTKAPPQHSEEGALSNLATFINPHFGNHMLPQEGPF